MLDKIIRMFREKEDFISGEEMSRQLGITRAAIWKKIKSLRAMGYQIQASPSKGYKILKTPEFSVDEIKTLLRGSIGREILYFESLDSTNTIAMELAEKSVSDAKKSVYSAVIIADTQTRGKGRLGRTWVSPPKSNIYMSVIIKPELAPRHATLLTIMAAVSCCRAVRSATGLEAKIKWPNDLMLFGKKFGGILTEIKSDPDRILYAVIGIGINVNVNPSSFPPDIQPCATSIKEHLKRIQSRTILIAEILNEMDYWHKILNSGDRKTLTEEWRALSSTIGEKVKVTAGREIFTGTAQDIDDDGVLILRLESGAVKKINAGDVTLLR